MPEPGALAMAGIQTAQQALGGGMGLLFGAAHNRQQYKQAEKLQNLQIGGQMQMGEFNRQQQMKLWEETNYKAQTEQLKQAGLNPGLLYGMGGGGGASTSATPGSVSGQQAAHGSEAVQMAGMAPGVMQMALMKAQKENIDADTANKKAENPNIPLQGGEIKAKTADLLQGVNNKKAEEALTNARTAIADLEVKYANESMEDRLTKIQWEGLKAIEDCKKACAEGNVAEGTVKQKIEMVEAELAGVYAKNALTGLQGENLGKQLTLEWAKLANMKDQTEINKKLQEFETEFGKQAGGVVSTILQLLRGRK